MTIFCSLQVFVSGEFVKEAITEKNSAVASDGKNYQTIFYNLDAIISVTFKKVQNKMRYSVHGLVVAELIVNKADAEKKHMKLNPWENDPDREIVKACEVRASVKKSEYAVTVCSVLTTYHYKITRFSYSEVPNN